MPCFGRNPIYEFLAERRDGEVVYEPHDKESDADAPKTQSEIFM